MRKITLLSLLSATFLSAAVMPAHAQVVTGTAAAKTSAATTASATNNAGAKTTVKSAVGLNNNTKNSTNVETGATATGNTKTNNSISNDPVSENTAPSSTLNPDPNADINWTKENGYWMNHHSSRAYYNNALDYSEYEPAYRFGVERFNEFGSRAFSQLDDATLQREWENNHGNSHLTWAQAKGAANDSYNKLYGERQDYLAKIFNNPNSGASLGAIEPAAGPGATGGKVVTLGGRPLISNGTPTATKIAQ